MLGCGLVGLGLSAQGVRPPEVTEHRLGNGVRLLLVPRASAGTLHVAMVAERRQPEPSGAPLAAFEMLRRCLSRLQPMRPDADLAGLQEALAQEDRLRGSLRTDRHMAAREQEGLRTLHEEALKAVARHCEAALPPQGVPWGGQPAWTHLDGDALAWGLDLRTEDLGTWAEQAAHRFRGCLLEGFPAERDRWLAEWRAGSAAAMPWPVHLHALLPAMLGGGPYAGTSLVSQEDVEQLSWAQVRRLGQTLLAPDRITLVLVGEADPSRVLPLFEATFGRLPEGGTPAAWAWAAPGEGGVPATNRRMQATLPGPSRLVVALHRPAATHPDAAMMPLLTELLRELLEARLVGGRLARQVTVNAAFPGAREGGLLLVEVHPAPERALSELDAAVQGVLLGLQRELPSPEVLQRAQRRLETAAALLADDGPGLARALGLAAASSGDWKRDLGARPVDPGGLHRLLRVVTAPGSVFTAQTEPDVLLSPQDPTEVRLLRVLQTLVARAIQDPAQVQQVVRDTMIQIRQMAAAERVRTLAMLEKQVR